MPVETAYNVVLFGSFVLTGYTSWLLLRYLLERAGHGPWLSAAAALAGACVFNFSRYHLDHAIAHLNLSALEGLPLYLLCFFRWLDEGKRKWLVGLALCALYVLLCDYYYLVYIALFSLLWVVAERWKRGPLFSADTWRDPVVRRAVVAGVAAGLACVPPMVPLLLHAFPAPLQIHHGDSDYFTDLYAFFIPDTRSAWMTEVPEKARAFAQDLVRAKMSGNVEESGTFLVGDAAAGRLRAVARSSGRAPVVGAGVGVRRAVDGHDAQHRHGGPGVAGGAARRALRGRGADAGLA